MLTESLRSFSLFLFFLEKEINALIQRLPLKPAKNLSLEEIKKELEKVSSLLLFVER